MKRLVLTGLLCVALVACGSSDSPRAPARPDWVIQSRIEFRGGEPLPLEAFRLWVPFISGDLYGAPTSGSYIQPIVRPDYTFEIDLNQGHDALLASLEKTAFSVHDMRIEPQDARIARISPFLMEADGIESLGRASWEDAETGHTLMLVYFDRPARIAGHGFAVDAKSAGYVWVETPPAPALAHVVPRPKNLVLAVSIDSARPAP